jgi:8-oxo-dGTP pyrophosphatase MutT (NUDIX family)
MTDPRYAQGMDELMRHIKACNNATLPGRRQPFLVADQPVGWVAPGLAAFLASRPEIISLPAGLSLRDPALMETLVRAAVAAGLCRWRAEAFDVRSAPGEPVLAQIDRGALPAFGIMAEGVHANGLVRRADGVHLWVARRAANKTLDPGKLDHIVAGGIPSGLTPAETLVKEAAEEAGMPAALAARAVKTATIGYAMERMEGLRRDVLHCYDIDLPEDFVPHAADGEVESFELWPLSRVLDRVRRTDDFKFNVNLVLIDLFLREGVVAGEEATRLRTAIQANGSMS